MLRKLNIIVLLLLLFVSIIKAFDENINQEYEDILRNQLYQQNQQEILCNCPHHIDRRLGLFIYFFII
jgi:hypothetical protein